MPLPHHDLAQGMRGVRRARTRSTLRMVFALLALAVLLPLLANGYWIKTLISAMAIAIAVSGTALLYGQLGLVSLCQYALVGVG